MDPRVNIIDERFRGVKRVIAVSGGKGGIGKSSVASILALCLSDEGYEVGLLDLDFCGPSCHVILGIEGVYPEEEKGVLPPKVHNIKFMSIVYYAKDNPLAARGIDISNSIIELLTITIWQRLDFLIIDMPPGIGDATLDVIRLIKKIEFLVVTTPSRVALETVKKTVTMLKEAGSPILGIIENMRTQKSSVVEEEIKKMGVRFLGSIRLDEKFEDSLGDREKLIKTNFLKDVGRLVEIKK